MTHQLAEALHRAEKTKLEEQLLSMKHQLAEAHKRAEGAEAKHKGLELHHADLESHHADLESQLKNSGTTTTKHMEPADADEGKLNLAVLWKPSGGDSRTCKLLKEVQFQGEYMWDELVDTPEHCCARCYERGRCRGFSWKTSTECHMYHGELKQVKATNAVSGFVTHVEPPPDCRWGKSLSRSCDCPPSTWAFPDLSMMTSREAACKLLHGKKILFSGDSLIRDQFHALAMWLLVLDGIDARRMGLATDEHAVCMVNADKFRNYLKINKLLEQRKLFSQGQAATYSLCGGSTTLSYRGARRFNDQQNIANTEQNKPDIWVLGSGVHMMVEYGDNTKPVTDFANWLSSGGTSGFTKHAIFQGTHFRIIERAPTPYRGYAQGPQGNAKIQKWNSIMIDAASKAGSKVFDAIDPFVITSKLDKSYRDTEDGMHMGFWVNLQKVQLILEKIRKRAESR